MAHRRVRGGSSSQCRSGRLWSAKTPSEQNSAVDPGIASEIASEAAASVLIAVRCFGMIESLRLLRIASRTSSNSNRPAPADRRDGDGQSDVGRGTDRRGAPREAWDSRVAPDGQPLHALEDDTTPADRLTGVEHVRAESCAVRAGV